jgi:histidinol dehydrogenase
MPFGDYGVALNVVLPTGGTEVAVIARGEGLDGHARAVEVRTDERRARS